MHIRSDELVIFSTYHPKAAKCTFLPNAHTFCRTDHVRPQNKFQSIDKGLQEIEKEQLTRVHIINGKTAMQKARSVGVEQGWRFGKTAPEWA